MSHTDGHAVLDVLEIVFPAPPCDVILTYFTHAVIGIPTGCRIIDDTGFWDEQDWGNLLIQYGLHEEPNQSGIVPSFVDFSIFPAVDRNRTTHDYIWVEQPFYGAFPVSAFVNSALYIGANIHLRGSDSYVSIGTTQYTVNGAPVGSPESGGYFHIRVPDWADTNEFYGVYYVMTPR